MTSGLRYEESGTPWGDDAQTYYGTRRPGGAFLARGNLGQFVFVDPRRDVVIARFGDDDGGVHWSSLFEQVASLAVTERG